jgi:hypothetical protein
MSDQGTRVDVSINVSILPVLGYYSLGWTWGVQSKPTIQFLLINALAENDEDF